MLYQLVFNPTISRWFTRKRLEGGRRQVVQIRLLEGKWLHKNKLIKKTAYHLQVSTFHSIVKVLEAIPAGKSSDIKTSLGLDVQNYPTPIIPANAFSPRQRHFAWLSKQRKTSKFYVRQFTTTLQGDNSAHQRHIAWYGSGSTVDARSGSGNALYQIICFNTVAEIKGGKHRANWKNGRAWRKCKSGRESSRISPER